MPEELGPRLEIEVRSVPSILTWALGEAMRPPPPHRPRLRPIGRTLRRTAQKLEDLELAARVAAGRYESLEELWPERTSPVADKLRTWGNRLDPRRYRHTIREGASPFWRSTAERVGDGEG